MRIDGTYDDWIKQKEINNKLSWIKEQKQLIVEFRNKKSPEFCYYKGELTLWSSFIKENGDDVVINKDGEWVKVPWEFKNKKGKVVNGLKVASQAGFQLRLRTTFENEMSNLLQMAVDNPKEGLLSEFDFSFDFIVRRMFYGTLNGKEVVTSFNKNTLRALPIICSAESSNLTTLSPPVPSTTSVIPALAKRNTLPIANSSPSLPTFA